MLISLHVKNMALIQEMEVEFGPGFNILTGETGAGKSIVIGSVNVALGTGNFKDYVPEGSEYALVELVFETRQPGILEKMVPVSYTHLAMDSWIGSCAMIQEWCVWKRQTSAM